MLARGAELISCLGHQDFLRRKVVLQIGQVALRRNRSNLNEHLDVVFVVLEGLHAKLVELKLRPLPVSLLFIANGAELSEFKLDALHALHLVQLVESLL